MDSLTLLLEKYEIRPSRGSSVYQTSAAVSCNSSASVVFQLPLSGHLFIKGAVIATTTFLPPL